MGLVPVESGPAPADQARGVCGGAAFGPGVGRGGELFGDEAVAALIFGVIAVLVVIVRWVRSRS